MSIVSEHIVVRGLIKIFGNHPEKAHLLIEKKQE